MMRCNKTGLSDKDFKTILDVLNVYDPNDVIDNIPEMGTPEFMQDVNAAFKTVLAHVNTIKYNSDMGTTTGNPVRYAEMYTQSEQDEEDDLDEQDYTQADMQRSRESQIKYIQALAHEQYIHGLS